MAFQVITDMEQADMLWEADMLWFAAAQGELSLEYVTWVHLHDFRKDNVDRMAPSKWRPSTGLKAYYAVLLED